MLTAECLTAKLEVSGRMFTNEPVSQTGIVVEWLKPFSFKVRLENNEVIYCGLERSYFGRMLPQQAYKHLKKEGPHLGDEVAVLISENRAGGMRHGVILRRHG